MTRETSLTADLWSRHGDTAILSRKVSSAAREAKIQFFVVMTIETWVGALLAQNQVLTEIQAHIQDQAAQSMNKNKKKCVHWGQWQQRYRMCSHLCLQQYTCSSIWSGRKVLNAFVVNMLQVPLQLPRQCALQQEVSTLCGDHSCTCCNRTCFITLHYPRAEVGSMFT